MMVLLLALAVQQPGDSLTLAAALANARAHRPLTVATAADVAEAGGALRSAGAMPNPSVSYSHSESYPVNHLTVEQSFDWLLTRGPSRAAARSDVARARADSMQAMVQLDHEVRYAYWTARATSEAARLVQVEEAEADSLARIASARYGVGEISLLEREQAAQEAARARQAASRAREDARVATLDLMRVLGPSAGSLIPTDPLDTGLDAIPSDRAAPALTPAVRSAMADSVAAAAQLTATSRSRIPLPAFQAGAEWGDPSQPGTLSTIGFAIPLPLWNQNGGAMMEAHARAARATALLGEARLDAWHRIASARIHLDETAYRARLARDSLVPSAARIRGRAMRGYAAGETGIEATLDALRSERQVVLEGVQDQLAFQRALADWYFLAGYDQ
jgi:cobalt-zinc-cadmium efflux system outer membrane protein